MTEYGSYANVAREKYIQFLKADFEIYIYQMEQRMDPMFDIAKLRVELESFHNYLYFQNKEDSKEIRERIKNMVDLIYRIERANNDAYTYQLMALQSSRELTAAKERIKLLEDALREVKEKWGVGPVKNIDTAAFFETDTKENIKAKPYKGPLLPRIDTL